MIHGPLCPAVKALELDPYGNVTRVEFMTPMDLRIGTGEDAAAPASDDYPRKGPGGAKT